MTPKDNPKVTSMTRRDGVAQLLRHVLLIVYYIVAMGFRASAIPALPNAATIVVAQDGSGDINGSSGADIQSAIDNVTSRGGGLVIVREGIYLCSKSLCLSSNISLKGTGPATILKLNGPDQFAVIQNRHFDTPVDVNITVNSLAIEPGKGKVTCGGVTMSNVRGGRISDIQTTGLNCAGIALRYSSECRIDGNRISGGGIELLWTSHDNIVTGNMITDVVVEGVNDGHGILVSGGAGPGYRNIISNNTVLNVRGIGISIDGGSYQCIVTNNIVDGATMDGINLEGWNGLAAPYDCTIANNIVRHARIAVAGLPGLRIQRAICTGNIIDRPRWGTQDIDGLLVQHADTCTISNNIVSEAGWNGMVVTESDSNTIVSNTVKNSKINGIKLQNAQRNTVSANRCFDDQATPTQQCGLAETGNSNHNLITANVLLNNIDNRIGLVGQDSKAVNNLPNDIQFTSGIITSEALKQ
ncbi:MAG: NosD domain-containing protein [bacterium]|nr:right-handed parallel beta-helix repeat-containing protein [Candidatus Sumerlaeota bacterium]